MTPHRTKKKTVVWKKNPRGVGAPLFSQTVKSQPSEFCVILYVSGLATRKKMSVE
jgi:hypothetical protein